ncbi:50S ribosomal protein L16 [candidate division WOR-3 bacterium JGI_Cruoil_03_51_56]|uniref:Large ribosomal subunit protein uL16 n=1 Tax=candidate division WOR-3 bacterium JGI_Cruoil_03_51_56 TaxID=1973747 RepID=A0A235BVA6_UNCW3|nr:MAG: 50S ribosomal protein L16 [candidate division WOR-3 bacterium JGI_Cruoil_03_51_56]
MLMPKRVKHRKQMRGRMKGKATAVNRVDFGEYGLMALEPTWITARQIEAARICLAKALRRAGKLWIRIFPDKPVTKKAAESRMGKGKGAPEFWVCVVKPGTVMFELGGIPKEEALRALWLAGNKMPCKTRIVAREGMNYEGF